MITCRKKHIGKTKNQPRFCFNHLFSHLNFNSWKYTLDPLATDIVNLFLPELSIIFIESKKLI